MSTLKFEARGCNFSNNPNSDVNNYRICTTITDKKDRQLFIEFGRGYRYRFTNKRTGAKLKKPVIETEWALHIDTQFDDERGSWRDLDLEKRIYQKNLNYTKADILKAVNSISKVKYTAIEIS